MLVFCCAGLLVVISGLFQVTADDSENTVASLRQQLQQYETLTTKSLLAPEIPPSVSFAANYFLPIQRVHRIENTFIAIGSTNLSHKQAVTQCYLSQGRPYSPKEKLDPVTFLNHSSPF